MGDSHVAVHFAGLSKKSSRSARRPEPKPVWEGFLGNPSLHPWKMDGLLVARRSFRLPFWGFYSAVIFRGGYSLAGFVSGRIHSSP